MMRPIVLIFLIILFLVSVAYSPAVLEFDEQAFLRELVLRTGRAIYSAFLLFLLLWIWDKYTPGKWMERIYEDPIACAIVVAGLLYVFSVLLM